MAKISKENESLLEDFSGYNSVGEIIPGEMFNTYTKQKPEIVTLEGSECIKVGSASDSDNILLMNSSLEKYGSLTVKFDASADNAPEVNWGQASHILVRYTNDSGIVKNVDFIEFAYNLIRVYSGGKEVKAASFTAKKFCNFEFNISKNSTDTGDVFKISYTVGSNTYSASYPTCTNGKICIGFHSIGGNAIYIDNLYKTETKGYEQPTASEIQKYIEQNNPAHPRILMNSNRLEKIRSYIKSDERFASWYSRIKTLADTALEADVSKYELRDGERLLYVSRDVYSNAVYPAFVYLIDGDEKYKERAWEELSAAASFSDWHPTHFLDTAEMTYAFAICYDWLYDTWTAEQRNILKNAIKTLGLDAAASAYNGTAEYDSSIFGAYHNRIGWVKDKSNWGLVCNGGIACGALAIIDDDNSDYCAEIIEKAIKGIETPLSLYTSDGSWSEGIGYWNYATEYLCYMVSSIENTLGTDLGCLDIDGIKNSAKYLIGHTGPCGTFNYGDCGVSAVSAAPLFYLADKLNSPDINTARLGIMNRFAQTGGLDDIIFFNPDIAEASSEFERNMLFENLGVAIGSSSTNDKQANYIGIKGGPIGVTHGDLDAGSFVIDALGVRWASDLGSDTYTLSGYFETPYRYNYYRKRAEGHNTLVINPDGEPDQNYGTTAYITDYCSGDGGMCAVMDMTEQYSDDAESVVRAAALFDNNTKFIIRDTVRLKEEGDIYWFMQTATSIKMSDDKKKVTLSSGDKHMLMVLDTDCSTAEFSYTSATPLSISPSPAGQAANTGYQRLSVASNGVKELNMQIIFIPYTGDTVPDTTDLPKLDSAQSVAEWSFDKKQGVNVTLKNDQEILNKLNEGEITVNVRDYDAKNDIMIAQYDSTGVLKHVKIFPETDNASYVLKTESDDIVKLFFWNMNTMKSFRNAITVTNNGIF